MRPTYKLFIQRKLKEIYNKNEDLCILKIVFCFLIVPVVNNFTVLRCCNRLNHFVAGATNDGRKMKHGDSFLALLFFFNIPENTSQLSQKMDPILHK